MNEAYEGWAIVEQLGHRRAIGKVSEIEMFGTKLLRLEVPVFEEVLEKKTDLTGENTIKTRKIVSWVTRYCGGPSIYQVTPLTEDAGMAHAEQQSDPRPPNPAALRPLLAYDEDNHDHHYDDDEDRPF
jgi:hypothetical protein